MTRMEVEVGGASGPADGRPRSLLLFACVFLNICVCMRVCARLCVDLLHALTAIGPRLRSAVEDVVLVEAVCVRMLLSCYCVAVRVCAHGGRQVAAVRALKACVRTRRRFVYVQCV